ncbi:MAG: DUF2797 domain-containing protein, partial [Gammaproteobacteria bacterium]
HCGRKIKKSFNQGYCYPCFTTLAQCDICIVKPEQCHYHKGTCREPEWGESHCMQQHFVYLATSSGVKVGITRHTQIPTRWIDQGAVEALPILKVASRYISGLAEIAIARHVNDKTGWQRMLKNHVDVIDLTAKRDELFEICRDELKEIEDRFGEGGLTRLPDEKPVKIVYPVLKYPDKVKSFNLDKTPLIEGVLLGIKGQYLIFDSGVINIRKYAGYEVIFEVEEGEAAGTGKDANRRLLSRGAGGGKNP